MEHINALINKMNANTSEIIKLEDLAPLSLHEIHALSEKDSVGMKQNYYIKKQKLQQRNAN